MKGRRKQMPIRSVCSETDTNKTAPREIAPPVEEIQPAAELLCLQASAICLSPG